MFFFKESWEVLKQTSSEWLEDCAARLGAALAFYSVLSLAPLLVIVLAIAATVFGEEAARGQLMAQIEDMVGTEGARAIQEMLAHAQQRESGILATALGVITLLFGAAGVFGQLQDALNTIWEVQSKPGRAIWDFLKARFFSFAMVLGTGFLLLVSLVLSAGLAALTQYMSGALPGLGSVWEVVNFVVSFGVITLLFALIFKVVPDVKIAWKDVWIGAALTALLFTIGKFLLGLYFGLRQRRLGLWGGRLSGGVGRDLTVISDFGTRHGTIAELIALKDEPGVAERACLKILVAYPVIDFAAVAPQPEVGIQLQKKPPVRYPFLQLGPRRTPIVVMAQPVPVGDELTFPLHLTLDRVRITE